ncbi:CinA family protein [Haloquadratum walsbyi]|nr:CinA family protein [Haloquadratum walsbyi]
MRDFATDPPVEVRVGEALEESEATVAIAESCTGGLIGSLLTDIPGASGYFDRSVVTYSYDSKLTALGVSREALDEHGAVSESVASEMAAGIRDTAGVDWGVATTGIAGPTGETDTEPVGAAYVGIAYQGEWGSNESYRSVERTVFDGQRTAIKEQIARRALELLLESIHEQI